MQGERSIWIKVCGMTSRDAVAAALEAGADAIGFVFAPSIREVPLALACQLAQPARGKLQIVAVMQRPEPNLWAAIDSELQPDIWQSDGLDSLRVPTREPLSTLPVVRAGTTDAAALPPRMLYEGARSGTGKTVDWLQAAAVARRTQMVLAGGLGPENVAAAIRTVRPWGVDASSGLEQSPGVKSPQKIFDYVRAARAAALELSE